MARLVENCHFCQSLSPANRRYSKPGEYPELQCLIRDTSGVAKVGTVSWVLALTDSTTGVTDELQLIEKP
jgi:hypothetical protein